MNWSIRVAALVLVVLPFSSSRSVRADDEAPRRYDLGAAERWEVGEVVTRTRSRTSEVELTTTPAGGDPSVTTRTESDSSVCVWKCLATDEKGRPKRSLVYVKSWSSTKGGLEDTSATGAFAEVRTGAWTYLTPDIRPSNAARKWMAKEFLDKAAAAGPHVWSELGNVPALAVGETWKATTDELKSLLLGGGEGDPPPFGVDGIDLSLRLESAEPEAEGTRLECGLEMAGPIRGDFAAGPKGVTYTIGEGSRLDFRGTMSALEGRSHRSASATVPGEITLNLDIAGTKKALVAKLKIESAAAPGGEMPEVPAGPGVPGWPEPPARPPTAPGRARQAPQGPPK